MSVLADAEVIFSGWGGPVMDEEFVRAAKKLKAVFYAAGSIRGVVSEAFWGRGIEITSAYAANAIPVAEYALAQILLCLKHGWHLALAMKVDRRWPPSRNVPGAYGSTVGIISLGMAGSRVAELLRSFEVKVLAYDPFVAQEKARSLNVEMCPLEEVFLRSDVVTLHTPWLKETEGMITGRHFASMRSGATFINTARGAVVREQEMIQVLKERPDLFAVLDVTWPEPPESDSALYSLPNVILTPHIAGAMGPECRRLGRYMVEELQRYVAGRPLRWAITREQARLLA
jgi:phosphoglycerate dehydrogenase-like enzyme